METMIVSTLCFSFLLAPEAFLSPSPFHPPIRAIHHYSEPETALTQMNNQLIKIENNERPLDIYWPNYDRLRALKARYDPGNVFNKLFSLAPAVG